MKNRDTKGRLLKQQCWCCKQNLKVFHYHFVPNLRYNTTIVEQLFDQVKRMGSSWYSTYCHFFCYKYTRKCQIHYSGEKPMKAINNTSSSKEITISDILLFFILLGWIFLMVLWIRWQVCKPTIHTISVIFSKSFMDIFPSWVVWP